MADEVTVRVDATRATARLNNVDPSVRNRLRVVLPDLVRRLASLVNNELATQLKSHNTLNVTQEMVENTKELYGRVALTSPSANGLLPVYLEAGTKPHQITGNPILAFPWDFMGAYGGSVSSNTSMAFFRSIKHPGTRAYRFMGRAFESMQTEIVDTLKQAAREGAKKT